MSICVMPFRVMPFCAVYLRNTFPHYVYLRYAYLRYHVPFTTMPFCILTICMISETGSCPSASGGYIDDLEHTIPITENCILQKLGGVNLTQFFISE